MNQTINLTHWTDNKSKNPRLRRVWLECNKYDNDESNNREHRRHLLYLMSLKVTMRNPNNHFNNSTNHNFDLQGFPLNGDSHQDFYQNHIFFVIFTFVYCQEGLFYFSLWLLVKKYSVFYSVQTTCHFPLNWSRDTERHTPDIHQCFINVEKSVSMTFFKCTSISVSVEKKTPHESLRVF